MEAAGELKWTPVRADSSNLGLRKEKETWRAQKERGNWGFWPMGGGSFTQTKVEESSCSDFIAVRS